MTFEQRRRVELDPRALANNQQRQTTNTGQRIATTKARHSGFLQAVHRLDAHLDAAACAELAKYLRTEYEREFGDVPIGLVSKCYLGPPYVDHRLDLFQTILEHYSPAQVMPDPFGQARMLARSGVYEYVEVYASGAIRPVRADGTAV